MGEATGVACVAVFVSWRRVSLTGLASVAASPAASAPTAAPRCSGVGDEVEVSFGTLDAPDRFSPTYERWTIRREA